MHTSSIHTRSQDTNDLLSGAHKTILTFAALLSLDALITHHPGVVALIAAAALLVQVAIRRITETPEAGTAAHVSSGLACRRITDGGTFRGAEGKNASSRSRQTVIVMDGGIH